MKILLYNPGNGVTRNFMLHLWMFLLQALTPPEHEVILIDGNAKAMTDSGDAALRAVSEGGAAGAAEALVGVRAVRDGARALAEVGV